MFQEAKKIQLIEDVLKVKNEATLLELERILKKSKNRKSVTVYDFVGVFSKKEVTQVKKAISESCEIIHPDEWR